MGAQTANPMAEYLLKLQLIVSNADRLRCVGDAHVFARILGHAALFGARGNESGRLCAHFDGPRDNAPPRSRDRLLPAQDARLRPAGRAA